jgi:DNA recombination protein RmuC
MSRLQGFNDSVLKRMTENAGLQNSKLDGLTRSTEQKFEKLEQKVEEKLAKIQEDNTRKLDEMRKTVDEKLEGTLRKRLGDSFKLVSDRLEQVHKGLGEMQSLASGVGDLTKALTNVKVRGTWGEIQLGALLDQILTPDQYLRNAKPREGSDVQVEYAIKLPGREETEGQEVLMPIDSKYPKEDYERLIDASERGDLAGIDDAGKKIEQRVRLEAKTISEKYLNPPATTDFAIMFLPIEGLYGEVIRRPGLVERLQREYRVIVSGPTTLAALLNSLQMGFRTLAIQKRSSEVWKVLAAVKSEFEKFGGVIERVQRKLHEASDTIEQKVAVRTRAISRKLRDVQELPAADAQTLIDAVPDDETAEGGTDA